MKTNIDKQERSGDTADSPNSVANALADIISSGESLPGRKSAAPSAAETISKGAGPGVASAAGEVDPVFEHLAAPRLPVLEDLNRAKLLIQSPTRLFFYWSLAGDPCARLRRAIGGRADGYALAVRLSTEFGADDEIYKIENEGSHWFDAEPNLKYFAEIGFAAPRRPFISIIKARPVTTPRANPSARPAEQSEWRVGAERFASVLDASGFARDAVDVAMAGDDPHAADATAHAAFAHLTGASQADVEGISPAELRFILLALAAGTSLDALKAQISRRLFGVLAASRRRLDRASAAAVVSSHFESFPEHFADDEPLTAVYGPSGINFPRRGRPFSSPPFRAVSSRAFS